MFKNFLMKKMLKSQLKGVPDEYIDKLITAIEQNPELFKKIADEIQEKIKGGQDQMSAATAVMEKYKDQVQAVMK